MKNGLLKQKNTKERKDAGRKTPLFHGFCTPMAIPMKKTVYWLLLCLLALYLTGCAAVTTTGPVDPGLRRVSAVSHRPDGCI
ncbi:hypothetical protein D1841_00550 [Neglecta sp. X4]|nr:hypothetical protein [Neglectibacter sp. 59]NBJ71850.1 hypothetical protein [Neglectibacter sp. X4]NCE79627.1 hypothetical protein [Neglectibacter sp. X58]